jgi:hypothetical protein
MALVLMDGFDLYSSAAHISRRGWVPGAAGISLQTGRFGTGQALRISSANSVPVVHAITSDDTICVGVAIKSSNIGAHAANGSDVIQLMNGSTVIARVGFTSSGHVRIGRGDYTTNLIATSGPSIVLTDVYNFFEIEFTRDASAGEVDIYMNGTLVATASSANTGASAIDNIGLVSGIDNKDFDDLYVVNAATKLGECKIETIRPSADTATSDFTPSTGSDNFAMVDETLIDDDTTYNSSATAAHKDLFDLANLAETPSAVKAVQLVLTARKDDTDTREIRTNMKNGSTTTNGTTRGLSTSYVMYTDIYETNPDDAAPFDGTDINAMQLGYEVVT